MPKRISAFAIRAFRWARVTLAPNFGVAILNFCIFIISLRLIVSLFFVMAPSPIVSVRTLEVLPETHVVDRTKGGSLTVVRELVMSRAATVQVTRVWIDEFGGLTPTLDDYISVDKGTTTRARVRIYPPSTLAPGKHRYRVGLRWCNPEKCDTTTLEDIEVIIIGDPPSMADRSFQDHRF